ncbi:MAG TPA: DinB family protein [Dehalococcoidia bacterium]
MSFAEHARSLVSYNEWANEKLLDAAQKCSEEQFAGLCDQFAHMVGTQLFWLGLWRGGTWVTVEPELKRRLAPVRTSSQMWAAYAESHDDLRAFVMELDDADWHRAKAWWVPSTTETLPLGDTITQVVNHGTQHRAELGVLVSGFGHSPGDLDYLDFALEMHGARA